MTDMTELFGNVIHTYSRAQAIEDGVLVDLNEVCPDVCAEHFKHPIACTSAVWAIIEKAVNNPRWCNDVGGVVHDMLWMSRVNARELSRSARTFVVIIRGAGRRSQYRFKLVCGPGDSAEPVLTIMLPEED